MAHDVIGDKPLTQPASIIQSRTPDLGPCEVLGAIEKDLLRINASMELFCRKLGQVLPDISLEIYKTYRKACQTMDSLASESPAGLIEITVSSLDVCLARVDKNIREQKADDALLVKGSASIRAALPAVHDALEQFQTLIGTLTAAPLAPLETADTAPDIQTLLLVLGGNARSMRKAFADITTSQAALADRLSHIEALQTDIIHTVERHTALGVDALKDTLNSIIAILKDLIARSNATKAPIQTIMTALQVHDIVRQDLENIHKAIVRLRALVMGEDHPDGAAFRRHACSAAGDLLLDISGIIYEHTRTIDCHIQNIHEIISGVGVDKIHLADLLLINAQDQSTLDRALTEISDMFQGLITHLGTLMTHRRRQADALLALRKGLQALDQESRLAAEQTASLVAQRKARNPVLYAKLQTTSEHLRSLISTLMSLLPHTPMVHTPPHDAIDTCIALIDEGEASMRGNLLKIKHLLVDSIEGINDYAKRCMVAVLRFQHRMERLHRFLVRIPDIAAALKGSAGINGTTSHGESVLAPLSVDIMDAQLYEILLALLHPHIKTLHTADATSDDAPPDDGLTLF